MLWVYDWSSVSRGAFTGCLQVTELDFIPCIWGDLLGSTSGLDGIDLINHVQLWDWQSILSKRRKELDAF